MMILKNLFKIKMQMEHTDIIHMININKSKLEILIQLKNHELLYFFININKLIFGRIFNSMTTTYWTIFIICIY